MGFLKNFFTDVYATETKARPATGFQQLSEVELEAHLNVCRYGDFELSDAVTEAVASKRKIAEGEIRCQGTRAKLKEGKRPCHNLLRYKLTLGYV